MYSIHGVTSQKIEIFHLLVGNVNGICRFRILGRGEYMLENVRKWIGFSWPGSVDVNPAQKLLVS